MSYTTSNKSINEYDNIMPKLYDNNDNDTSYE